MRRTLIYLPEKSVRTRLVKHARVKHPGVAVILRSKLLPSRSSADAREFFTRLEAFGRTLNWGKGPHDTASTIKEYLYGSKSKYARRRQ